MIGQLTKAYSEKYSCSYNDIEVRCLGDLIVYDISSPTGSDYPQYLYDEGANHVNMADRNILCTMFECSYAGTWANMPNNSVMRHPSIGTVFRISTDIYEDFEAYKKAAGGIWIAYKKVS